MKLPRDPKLILLQTPIKVSFICNVGTSQDVKDVEKMVEEMNLEKTSKKSEERSEPEGDQDGENRKSS